MERFIDAFSRRMATAVSRRDVLRVASRAFIAAVAGSTYVGAASAVDNDAACPTCGSCQRCHLRSGKCHKCSEDITAGLYYEARAYSPYLALQTFLTQQQFDGGVSEALEMLDKHTLSSVLSTNYTGPSASQTATLVFTKADVGVNAYAVQSLNGEPQFGYFVSPEGQIQQLMPPYQVSAVATDPAVSADSAGEIGSGKSSGELACETYCNLICGARLGDQCYAVASAGCIGTIEFGPEAPLLCRLLAGALCSVGTGLVCSSACEGATCGSPANQPCGVSFCDSCQTCSSSLGICIPTICPSGYSCNSTPGSCTCDNLCGSTCCGAGVDCVNGHCGSSVTCPSGLTACGTVCCSANQTCAGGTCMSNQGLCSPNPCPNGETCCVNFLGQPGCGPAGYTCCTATGSVCPPGTTCCDVITSAGSAYQPCCTPNQVCLRSGTSSACCNPGAVFCPNPGAAGWCCAPGSQCGSSFNQCVQ